MKEKIANTLLNLQEPELGINEEFRGEVDKSNCSMKILELDQAMNSNQQLPLHDNSISTQYNTTNLMDDTQ